MAKDPAFLFYSSDFLTGTMFMNNEQVGKYIRLLCAQHQKGHLTEKDMLIICNSHDEIIFNKFAKDDDGLYYNVRCEEEINKRKRYSLSRATNRKSSSKDKKDMKNISKTYDKHMENENEIENVIIILNEILNTKYSSKAEKTKKLITARLKEGFKVEDFKTVINFKNLKWRNDVKMREFLRPETLFSNKFESYLQAAKLEMNQPPKMHY